MNFLAHIYLSGENEDIKLGNFVGDWIKGKEQSWNPKFNDNIKKGITIHRYIDNFTDRHEIVKKSSSRFSEKYGHYSKVVTDIVYDHFIAYNWHIFSNIELEKYAYDFYRLLIKKFLILPVQVKIFLPYMIASNRILTYTTIDGIKRTLEIMSKNTSLPAETDFAIDVLNNFYEDFKNETLEFMKKITDEIFVKFNIKV